MEKKRQNKDRKKYKQLNRRLNKIIKHEFDRKR